MNTNDSVVFSGMSKLIRENVLSPLVTYLAATKNCQVSVDELASILKLQSTSTPVPMTNTSMPNLSAVNMGMPMGFAQPMGYPAVNAPPTLTTFGGMPMPASKGKGKGKSTENIPDNEKCQYIVTRGRNEGQRCPSRAEPNIPFCKACKDKKAAQTQLQKGGTVPAPGPSSFPGLGGVASLPGMQAPGPAMGMMPMGGSFAPTGTLNQLNTNVANVLSAPTELPKIQVLQLGNGMYHEKNQNLLIKAGQSGYVCIGIYDVNTGNHFPLTTDKIEFCRRNNMPYVDPSVSNVTGQTLPAVNQQFPGVSAMSIPQVNMTIPSVNTQQFGLPQVPSVNGLGVFPSASNVADIRSPDGEDGDDDEDEDDEHEQ
jgi:hypothetical protein